MKKSDLRSGMVVKTKEGMKYLLIEAREELILVGKEEWTTLRHYRDDLLHDIYNDLDIVEIYATNHGTFNDMIEFGRLIWKRENKKKMTVSQIEKELGYEIEIVRED